MLNNYLKGLSPGVVLSATICTAVWAGTANNEPAVNLPPDIKAVVDKPLYKGAMWGLRVVDADTGTQVIDLGSHNPFFIGSVRKVFTIGELLNQIGPSHRYNTPVYRRGEVDGAGVLRGDLILVASGDLSMGGRTNPDGTIAITDFDHNEADALGNAELTKPDPLAGYLELAQQIAHSGIKSVTGNVIVDDRLFQPFNFRGQFNVRPIFVNDDVVDLIINPSTAGKPASVKWRPMSAALGIENKLMGAAGSKYSLQLNPELPPCIGEAHCIATVSGQLPASFVPPLTNRYPLIQTVRITEPANYARAVFIAALQAAGVSVNAATVARNPTQLLPPKNSYAKDSKIAELKGMPYGDYAKFILKVSYNIGADTSLVLLGLTHNLDNMTDALAFERQNLITKHGIPEDSFHFVDGSGGGSTTATNEAVTKMLADMKASPVSSIFMDCLPSLGVDGSLGFVKDFQSDATLSGATGQVHAKTGTYLEGTDSGLVLKGQAFGGYITTKAEKHLIYQLVVNNVKVTGLDDLLKVFQDQGVISAILWRDN